MYNRAARKQTHLCRAPCNGKKEQACQGKQPTNQKNRECTLRRGSKREKKTPTSVPEKQRSFPTHGPTRIQTEQPIRRQNHHFPTLTSTNSLPPLLVFPSSSSSSPPTPNPSPQYPCHAPPPPCACPCPPCPPCPVGAQPCKPAAPPALVCCR